MGPPGHAARALFGFLGAALLALPAAAQNGCSSTVLGLEKVAEVYGRSVFEVRFQGMDEAYGTATQIHNDGYFVTTAHSFVGFEDQTKFPVVLRRIYFLDGQKKVEDFPVKRLTSADYKKQDLAILALANPDDRIRLGASVPLRLSKPAAFDGFFLAYGKDDEPPRPEDASTLKFSASSVEEFSGYARPGYSGSLMIDSKGHGVALVTWVDGQGKVPKATEIAKLREDLNQTLSFRGLYLVGVRSLFSAVPAGKPADELIGIIEKGKIGDFVYQRYAARLGEFSPLDLVKVLDAVRNVSPQALAVSPERSIEFFSLLTELANEKCAPQILSEALVKMLLLKGASQQGYANVATAMPAALLASMVDTAIPSGVAPPGTSARAALSDINRTWLAANGTLVQGNVDRRSELSEVYVNVIKTDYPALATPDSAAKAKTLSDFALRYANSARAFATASRVEDANGNVAAAMQLQRVSDEARGVPTIMQANMPVAAASEGGVM